MLPILFAILRWRLLWRAVLVVTLAAMAFWATFAAVTAIMVLLVGAEAIESDPDRLVRVAFPVSFMTAMAATAAVGVVIVARRRYRTREWLPLRDAMSGDAAAQPSTYLAQVVTKHSPVASGHVLARDLITGYQGPLWLPGWDLPVGAVVCFADTPSGPQLRAWMSGKLWRATSRDVARVERRSARAFARAERDQHQATERRVRHAAEQTIAEAERILHQYDRR